MIPSRMLKPMNARISSHVIAFQDAYASAPMVSSAYLFVSSTISSTMSSVKYSSKTSSGDLGIGTVGPTEDVKGCIVGVTKLVDHS